LHTLIILIKKKLLTINNNLDEMKKQDHFVIKLYSYTIILGLSSTSYIIKKIIKQYCLSDK